MQHMQIFAVGQGKAFSIFERQYTHAVAGKFYSSRIATAGLHACV